MAESCIDIVEHVAAKESHMSDKEMVEIKKELKGSENLSYRYQVDTNTTPYDNVDL